MLVTGNILIQVNYVIAALQTGVPGEFSRWG